MDVVKQLILNFERELRDLEERDITRIMRGGPISREERVQLWQKMAELATTIKVLKAHLENKR